MPMWWLKVRFEILKNPHGDDQKKILIDLAHTYAIQGWRKDYLASASCMGHAWGLQEQIGSSLGLLQVMVRFKSENED